MRLSISSLCFYKASNRHSFSIIFKHDTTSPAALRTRRAVVIETMLAAARTS